MGNLMKSGQPVSEPRANSRMKNSKIHWLVCLWLMVFLLAGPSLDARMIVPDSGADDARIRTIDHTTAPQAYDISFSYDAEGRRVKKHVVEYADGSPVAEKTITYVWDGWELLYERHQLPSGLTTLERKYLWGPDIADGRAGGAGGLLLMREKRGDTTTEIIPLYDGTGHVVALTDIEKNLLAEYAYGPFGEKIHAAGPRAQSNPWRYATKYLDQETGLYYFGHRYYDPITGQWLSRELLGESESINLYVYAGNDPINHVDVQGLYKRALNVPTTDEIETLLSITRAAIEERKTELAEAHVQIAHAPRITSTITGRSHAADPSLRNRPGEIERQINKLTDQAAQLERALRISPLADASESFNSIPFHRALKREYGSVRDPEAMAFFAPEGGFLSGPELVAWERFIDGYFKEMTFATATMPFAVIGQARHLRHGGKVAGAGSKALNGIGAIKPAGVVDSSLGAYYRGIANSPEFARSIDRYNAFASRFSWAGVKPSASASEITAIISSDTTFARLGNNWGAALFEGGHGYSTRFYLQGSPSGLFPTGASRVGRHELLHMGAALKGQGDTFLHEIGVQLYTTPEVMFGYGGALIGGGIGAGYYFGQE